MTIWADELKIIRRFLRDPDGNIWSNALIRTTWNAAQQDFQRKTGLLEGLEAIPVPPTFDTGYVHDWEWASANTSGVNYQIGYYHHQSGDVCSYVWETETLANIAETTSDNGYQYTMPWEAFQVSSHSKVPPIPFPDDFGTARYIAWDNEPIDYQTVKNIQSDDTSWQTHRGKPFAYYMHDSVENTFCLFPLPETPVWESTTGSGIINFLEGDTDDEEYGGMVDRTTSELITGDGVAIDAVDTDDNVLIVYDSEPADIEEDSADLHFPDFVLKYIRFDTLSRLYSDNTDGRILSLRDYWKYRKEVGEYAIRRYKRLRRQDRDYAFSTRTGGAFRTRREPRLPDEYPAVPRW